MSLVAHVLVPAWNEAEKIGDTIESLLAQECSHGHSYMQSKDHFTDCSDNPEVELHAIIIPNGCEDNTAEIARSYTEQCDRITILEFKDGLANRKSEALNKAWLKYSQNADVVITVDADTTLAKDAVAVWANEFSSRSRDKKGRLLGGSVAKPIVLGSGYWKRMQKMEYARVVDSALIRGETSVLAGAGSAFSGKALRDLVDLGDGREGPWSYKSDTEDYEITLQFRMMGLKCIMSPYVRMFTDGMPNLRSLLGQRVKWSTGQYHELLNHGINKYTALEWLGHFMMTIMIAVWVLWMSIIVTVVTTAQFEPHWFWLIAYPSFLIGHDLFMCKRIAYVDKWDYLLAILILPYLFFRTIGMAWLIWSAIVVARERLTGQRADRWELQSRAEGN